MSNDPKDEGLIKGGLGDNLSSLSPEKIPDSKKHTGRFVKGQSGNPGGRKKGYLEIAAHFRAWLEKTPPGSYQTNLQKLTERLAAEDPKVILHYAFGKPVETHEISTTKPIEINVKPTINIEQLRVVAGAILGISGPVDNPKPIHPAIADTKASDVPERGGS